MHSYSLAKLKFPFQKFSKSVFFFCFLGKIKMEIISNNPGFTHIFNKIIGLSGYGPNVFTSDGYLVKPSSISNWLLRHRTLKLVCKNWKMLIENYEMSRLVKLSPSINNSKFPNFLRNVSTKLCRQDMVKYLHQRFPQYWQSFSNINIGNVTDAIVRCNNIKYPTIYRKLSTILIYCIDNEKEFQYLSFELGKYPLDVVKFIKARTRGDPIEKIKDPIEKIEKPFTMSNEFMKQNILEHDLDEDVQVQSEPDSDSSLFEYSESEDEVKYESDLDNDTNELWELALMRRGQN